MFHMKHKTHSFTKKIKFNTVVFLHLTVKKRKRYTFPPLNLLIRIIEQKKHINTQQKHQQPFKTNALYQNLIKHNQIETKQHIQTLQNVFTLIIIVFLFHVKHH